MASGIIDPKKQFRELPFYHLEGLCKAIVQEAMKDPLLRSDFVTNYQGKITRLSPEVFYCLDRLGFQIYDPLNRGLDIALVSDGKNFHFVKAEVSSSPDFNREDLKDEDAICPLLTDEVLHYKEELTTSIGIESGIVDEHGFVDSSSFGSVELLGEILLMFALMHDKNLYEKFLKRNENGYDFLLSLPNIIAIQRKDSGFDISYVDSNREIVEKFVEIIDKEPNLQPLVVRETNLPQIKNSRGK